MRHLHRILPLALTLGLMACGDDPAPPDSIDPTDLVDCDGPDAGPLVPDGGDRGDARAACEVTGDGSLYTQCCVFGAADPCTSGTACYLDWDPHATVADGGCFEIGVTEVGAVCDLMVNACIPGALCRPNAASPETGTGDCRLLCDPDNPCPDGSTCDLSIADGVGACIPESAP